MAYLGPITSKEQGGESVNLQETESLMGLVRSLPRREVILRLSATPFKLPICVCVEVDKMFLKFIWKIKGLRRAYTILKKRNKI